MSLKIRWVTWYPMQVGSSFGYSIHNDKTQDALERMGVLDETSKIGVYVAPPHLFHVLPELDKHYLYCAWETSTLPPLMIKRVRGADGVFVVSKFLTVPFGAIRPTKVAHLGVDDCFSYVKRYRPARGKPFRWLWCGAPNARKGWQVMVTVCDQLQKLRRDYKVPPFELYVKTSKPGESFVKRVGEHMIYDCRKLPVPDLVRLYHEAHAFCMPSFGEGFGLCVHHDTLLSTSRGPYTADAIRVGDLVLDANGRFNKVYATTQRKATQLCSIRVPKYGEIRTTPEHPFLVSTRRSRKSDTHPLEWRQAKNLRAGDLVAIAKAKLDAPLPPAIDIATIPGVEYDEAHVWYKHGFSSKRGSSPSIAQLSAHLGETKKVVETAIRYLRNGLPRYPRRNSRTYRVLDYLQESGYQLPQPVHYPRHIALDARFLEFVGWFIAEGSSAGAGELSLGPNDKAYIPILAKWLRSWGATTLLRKGTGKGLRLGFCHGPLVKWLKIHCGANAFEKQIPWQWYPSGHHLAPLLRGLFLGDGYGGKDGISLTSVSAVLVDQVRQILSGHSICTGIRQDRRNTTMSLDAGGLDGDRLDQLMGTDMCSTKRAHKTRRASAAWDIGTHLLVRVKSVETRPYHGVVYDFGIKHSHSFVGNGVILHNTPAEATRTGLPCLYTPGTGMDDFLEGYGYPIKVKIEPLFDWFAGPAHDREKYPHHFGPATVPQPQSMGELMVEVMVNYERALKRAKRAARRIAAEFTWDNTARSIVQGLEEWIDGKH